MEKRTLYGRLCEFYGINQFQMRTRGRGSKNTKLLQKSFMDVPLAAQRFVSGKEGADSGPIGGNLPSFKVGETKHSLSSSTAGKWRTKLGIVQE